MNNTDRIRLCNEALESVRGLIPADLYKDVHDYINRFNEWGLGLEILIDHISEFEITVSREQFETISVAMASMGLGQSDRVQYHREHNVSPI